jgi:hypothetical protein
MTQFPRDSNQVTTDGLYGRMKKRHFWWPTDLRPFSSHFSAMLKSGWRQRQRRTFVPVYLEYVSCTHPHNEGFCLIPSLTCQICGRPCTGHPAWGKKKTLFARVFLTAPLLVVCDHFPALLLVNSHCPLLRLLFL